MLLLPQATVQEEEKCLKIFKKKLLITNLYKRIQTNKSWSPLPLVGLLSPWSKGDFQFREEYVQTRDWTPFETILLTFEVLIFNHGWI